MDIETATTMFDALGSPTRLKIFHLLWKAGTEGLPVGTLVSEIGVPGSTLSHHLSKLATAGLVRQDRRATTLVCYAEKAAAFALSSYLVTDR